MALQFYIHESFLGSLTCISSYVLVVYKPLRVYSSLIIRGCNYQGIRKRQEKPQEILTPVSVLLRFISVLLLSNIFLRAQQELPPSRILSVLFFYRISIIYQSSCFKSLVVFTISKVFFFTINIKRGGMLARLAYYYIGRTGIVFR